MIVNFANPGTHDIANGFDTKAARKCLPLNLHRKAHRMMTILESALEVSEMGSPPGNRLEALKGDRAGFYSVRINDQWRIVFRWDKSNALDVEICDYH